MTNLKITFDGTLTKRWKETTKAGKEMVYIAVKVQRGEYPETFKVKARDAESVKAFAVGSNVTIEAWVGGRDWTNPETGKVSYFTDLSLSTIKQQAEQPKAEPKPQPAAAEDLDEMPF